MIAAPQNQLNESDDEFDLFFVRGRPTLAICARDRRFRAAAARRFPLYSLKRRIFRRLMQVVIALHLDRLWARRGKIPEALIGNIDFASWLRSIRESLGRQDLFPVVHGPPQVDRKRAYVHLLDASGQPVAFAKLAFDEINNAQLERETQMLTSVRSSAPRRFKTPLMLAHGLFNGNRFILFEPLPTSMAAVKIPWEFLRPAVHEIAGTLRMLSRDAVTESDWWKELERLPGTTPQFMRELQMLIADGLPVCLAHGDMGVNNLIVSEDVMWIIDWEQGSDSAPFRTDEISFFLSIHQQEVIAHPARASAAFAKQFLDTDSLEIWRDVLAALAFLAASGRASAQTIVSHWNLSFLGEMPNQAEASQRPKVTSSSRIAIISNEPTPYRLHVLRRLHAELNGVSVHNIFTHTISSPSMPWQMRIESKLNPVFFPNHHLVMDRPISSRSIPLYRDLKKYLQSQRIQMIVLIGYNDLTRLLLIWWARRASIPILLSGDSNIFADARTPALTRFFKGIVLRWALRHVFGLMPMGTCGRAFFRSYLDHRLPEFLFPYEPDYASLKAPDPIRLRDFREQRGLAASRKRLLYCGRLVPVKQVDVLISAFISMANSRPDWDLVIAGQGPLRDQLESLLPARLQHRVKWLGFIQFEEMAMLYHACDVLVHPADYEPWGVVINEAVACNLPIITTSVVGAAVELVRHQRSGIIVMPRSVESLAAAISDITRNDRYLQMRRWSTAALESWRKAADPVNAVREAMRHFGLHWTPAVKGGLFADQQPRVDEITQGNSSPARHGEYEFDTPMR